MKWVINTTPYEVQTEALTRSEGKTHWGHFLEMGLGKTQVTINEWLNHSNQVPVLIVVCPNTIKSNWKKEFQKSGVTWVDITISPDQPDINSDEKVVHIVNYEALIAKHGDFIEKLVKKRSCMLVLDESVQIKNFKARRTKRLLYLADYCHMVRLLSGAPMTQSVMDLWSQLKILQCPRISGSPYAFRNRFAVMGGYMNKQVVGVRDKEALQAMIGQVSWQAKKRDWTDLPEKNYTTMEYTMTGEQARYYKEMEELFLTQIKDVEEPITVQMAINSLQKLQQISSGFILDEDKEPHLLVPSDKNPKLRLLQETLEYVGGKTIIFALHRYMIDMVLENNPEFAFIRGGMSPEETQEQVDKFNGPNCNGIVCQVSSAKYGLTLLGMEDDPCHTTIYLENWFSLDARIQSEDRNHRHGQKNPVTYIDFIGSFVEKRVIDALQKKTDLVRSVMDFDQTAEPEDA